MSIHAALSLLLQEYAEARAQPFAGNAMADMLRQDIPAEIRASVANEERYEVIGSPGKGNWAGVPWVAVLDRFVTDTPQQGYYLVYLAKEDCTGVYLSLNQGVTTAREQYGASAPKALETRAQDFLARLGPLTSGLLTGPIDLGARKGLGADYLPRKNCSQISNVFSVCTAIWSITRARCTFALRPRKMSLGLGLKISSGCVSTSESSETGSWLRA